MNIEACLFGFLPTRPPRQKKNDARAWTIFVFVKEADKPHSPTVNFFFVHLLILVSSFSSFFFFLSRLFFVLCQVKVRKKSMAGRTEIRRLYVRGDTIELVNPEKRMFRSQSKMFPLSELTAVSCLGAAYRLPSTPIFTKEIDVSFFSVVR